MDYNLHNNNNNRKHNRKNNRKHNKKYYNNTNIHYSNKLNEKNIKLTKLYKKIKKIEDEINNNNYNIDVKVSYGELFTSSLFAIPTCLYIIYNSNINYDIFGVLFSAAVLLSSLNFHRHNIETRGNPNKIVRNIDIFIVILSTSYLFVKSSIYIKLCISTAPIFYFIEKFILYRFKDKTCEGLLFGPAGCHMCVHLIGIISFIYTIINLLKENEYIFSRRDYVYFVYGILSSVFLFIIFLPRNDIIKHNGHIYNQDIIESILGKSKSNENILSLIDK